MPIINQKCHAARLSLQFLQSLPQLQPSLQGMLLNGDANGAQHSLISQSLFDCWNEMRCKYGCATYLTAAAGSRPAASP